MNKTAFLYPGTGSQYTGMFKNLYEGHSVVRHTFEEAGESIGLDLARTCFEDGFPEEGSIANTQVAILACSVAGHRLLAQEVGLKPCVAAGHSLGEWSALTCAGALALPDGVKAVWQRGKWMEEAVPNGGGLIVAVNNLPLHAVKEYCVPDPDTGQIVEIACRNAPDQAVIAGHREAVERITPALESLGGKVVRLRAKVPFHTSLMRSAAEKLSNELANLSFGKLDWPVISNVTAEPHEHDPASLRLKLAEQLTTAVRWEETVRLMQRSGVHYAIEIGPHKVLKQLNRKTARNIRSYALDVPEDWPSMFELRRLKPAFIDQCLTIAVTTRNRNDDAEQYRKGAIEPYKRLLQIREQSAAEGSEPSCSRKKESFELLSGILACKRVAEEELNDRLADLVYQLNGEG
ncbi:ACP S-malonyltransferase [Cohnella herbarum]|uniref:[acyl-carrier-protein] S-malonyltransferase n=1 Tax=Cohnella herbarum TaxID=2728023 RepID=A0A7Z2ZKB8_9BACL|nr:ACP S-malonyltransferase [Cohnella herbarum]QJD81937.1 ACP S-malonyltransferase [Cohnella herbarum]